MYPAIPSQNLPAGQRRPRLAAEDIARGVFVRVTDTQVYVAREGEVPHGVSAESAPAGKPIKIHAPEPQFGGNGVPLLVAEDARAGQYLKPDEDGRGIVGDVNAESVFARLTSTGKAGDLARVEVCVIPFPE